MRSWRTFFTRHKTGIFWICLTGLTLAAVAAGLFFGSVPVSPGQVLLALTGGGGSSVPAKIVLYTRLPRVLGAILAGAALAVSGVVIQQCLHNPLASPGILGVNAGAGLAVAVVCAIFPLAQGLTPLVAFLGALGAVSLILFLSRATGSSRMTVVLAGVAVSNIFSAGIDAVVTLVPDALNAVSDFRIGGFSGVTLVKIAPGGWLIVLALAGVFSLAGSMDILALGDETAHSLGLRVSRTRFLLLTLAAALAGAAVSFAGLLGFVGLIVPHAMRRFVGEQSLPLLLASALGGGFFLTACDLLARTLFAPYVLPVGIVLSFTGGPFFLWLLYRQRGGRR